MNENEANGEKGPRNTHKKKEGINRVNMLRLFSERRIKKKLKHFTCQLLQFLYFSIVGRPVSAM